MCALRDRTARPPEYLGCVTAFRTRGSIPCAAMRLENKILKLQDVGLYYKKQAIVEHINLSAGIGEIIGVVGHNGAGKTTLSRTLCGLHKEASGQFLWNEKPQDRKERLRRSYMVMQDVNFELFADSVEAECSFGIRNPDKSLIETTMDSLGLLPYWRYSSCAGCLWEHPA